MATKKTLYELRGHIQDSDIDFTEFVYAYSEQQAKLLVRTRLQKLHPRMVIFIEWWSVQFAARKPKNSSTPAR